MTRIGPIRVRLSIETAAVANRVAPLLDAAGDIELPTARHEQADVLLLQCAALLPETNSRWRQTARRHQPARALWLLDRAPDAIATRFVLEAVKAGVCCGYLVGDFPAETLIRAIRAVASDDLFLPRALLVQALADASESRAAPRTGPAAALRDLRDPRVRALLTPRERQIFQQALRGLTNKEVGRSLGIKEDTVKKHLRKIYAKLGVRGRSQLLIKAVGKSRAADQA